MSKFKVGDKVKVVDGSGADFFHDKVGQVFPVMSIVDGECDEDLLCVVEPYDGMKAMFDFRFELVTDKYTTLPDVFTFATRRGDKYRMTKMADGDYACTEHDAEFKEGEDVARHYPKATLRHFNDGTWTFLEDITPLPRKFTIIATPTYFPTEFDVDLDAGTLTYVVDGRVYGGYTEVMAKEFIANGSWLVTKSKAERDAEDAEAKALADAEAAAKEARTGRRP